MPRLRLTLAYVGTQYSGWQIQVTKTEPAPVTVQGLLEEQLSRICERRTVTMACGRTDAGVHADCQVVHCDIPENKVNINWQLALNTSLPNDIRIKEYALVSDTFNALFDVERKAYTYRLWLDRKFTPPMLYPFIWACGPLDLDRVDRAIPYLLGTHDFASFQNTGTVIKSTVRTLFKVERSVRSADPHNYEIQLYFEADGFLKQMVRNLTGILVACGQGKLEPEELSAIIESKDRRNAPSTAPARGLCMTHVWYK